ncbi:MAG TPA: hypothetical protein VEL28_01820 [Candidatus Binatia bacterium]|nr:hypothetical protein [Candidatus Binatia bacterium]
MRPYRDDPQLAAELAGRARAQCQRRRGSDLPPYSFTTDGCSFSRDGTWKQCCVEHDIAYWCGGDRQARRQADAEFRRCVQASTDDASLACTMEGVLRIGGSAWLPFPWRWAYGWGGIRGYDSTGSGESSADVQATQETRQAPPRK